MEPKEIPLHDIKPLLEIPDYSLYYFIGLIVVSLIVLYFVIYFIYKWIIKKSSFNVRAEHKRLLDEVNFDDSKKAAYDITFYGATFKDDTPRHTKSYEELQEHLESYKYKKSVDKLDENTMRIIELYQGMIDV